ncbi:hypothetical protein MPSEU_000871100 [Mayamaea pseudoterrestris]|nr:hypothetical protein MPSEU_000871100 [Mayamaea pseudoterrestris]
MSTPPMTPTPTPASTMAATSSSLATSKSTNNNTSKSQQGATLTATIVSAFDLFQREPPLGIHLSIRKSRGKDKDTTTTSDISVSSATTGPPVQRHRNFNSFKFSSSESLTLGASKLSEIYHQDLVLKVLYEDSSQELHCQLPVQQLIINRPTWFMLSLSESVERSGSKSGTITTKTLRKAQSQEAPHMRDTEPSKTKSETTTTTPPPTPSTTTPASSTLAALPSPPTVRLQLTLSSPYRREVQVLVQLWHSWCSMVEKLERETLAVRNNIMGKMSHTTSYLRSMHPMSLMLTLVAAIPIVFAFLTMVILPALIVSVPMIVPLAIIGAALGAVAVLAFCILYASSPSGRVALHKLAQQWHFTSLATKLVESPTGQAMLYPTGVRPSPLQVTRDLIVPSSKWSKLVLSVAIDGLGNASYLIPLVGEVSDVVWAPLQTLLIMAMYDATSPNLKYVSFFEELLPFTDILPSATIGWFLQYGVPHVMERNGATAATSATTSAPTERASKMDPTDNLMMMHSPAAERVQ